MALFYGFICPASAHCLERPGWEAGTQQGWDVVPRRDMARGSPMRLLTQVEGEGCPLPGAGDEGSPLHGEVAGADGLGAQAVEEGHLGARGDAHCRGRWLG